MSFDQRWETDIYAKQKQINKYPFDAIVSNVFRFIGGAPDRSKVRVLEVGCGTANNIIFLAQEGFSATGLDASDSAIKLGRNALKERGLEAELLCQDFTDLSNFKSESFDMVIDRGSITHNSKDGVIKALDEIKRVLKTGGIFISHIFSDAHSGLKYGKPQGDGSRVDFSSGFFAGHKFVFYFAGESEVKELYGSRFKIISQLHNIQREYLNEDDDRAMWYLICEKAS